MELNKNSCKISDNQRKTLIEFIKKNNCLLNSKFSATFTYKDSVKKWEEISEILNSIPGAKKNWKSWKKTWQDLRSRTKMKYNKRNSYSRGTGGGPCVEDSITDTEKEIIEIIKPVCMAGHEDIAESTAVINLTDLNRHDLSSEQLLGEERNEENAQDEVPKETIVTPRKTPKRPVTKLKRTEVAVEKYQETLTRKIDIKEKYYKEKLQIMKERNLILQANYNVLQNISTNLEKLLNK